MLWNDKICKENEDNSYIHINIVLSKTDDIFQNFGYGGLKEKKLNNELEEYIFKSIKNYPLNKKVKLVIAIKEHIKNEDYILLEDEIHSHFEYKLKETNLYIKQQFKQWKINMIIGILFLVLCLILVEVLSAFSYINIVKILKESLVIVGWVALWEPMAFILFGFRAIKMDKLYYKKLCRIPMVIKTL